MLYLFLWINFKFLLLELVLDITFIFFPFAFASLMMRHGNGKFSESCVLLDLALMNEPTGTSP